MGRGGRTNNTLYYSSSIFGVCLHHAYYNNLPKDREDLKDFRVLDCDMNFRRGENQLFFQDNLMMLCRGRGIS